jgi:hypothetical protein
MRREDIFPANIEINTDIFSMKVEHLEDGYALISFTDDIDDAYSTPQTIKIHPSDLHDFANLINTAIKWLG